MTDDGPPDQPLCTRARALRRGQGRDGGDGAGGSGRDPYDEVVALLRRAQASGEPDAAGLLADTYLERGARRDAIDVLTPAVHGQGRSELAGLLGEVLAALGDHIGAEDAYLVGLADGHLRATNDYGVFLRDRGRTQEATYVLDRAARGGDELAPLNLVALHLEALDDPDTATAVAERYHDEARPTSLIALADVRLAAGRLDDAEALYRRAAELGGISANVYLAWFLQDRRRDLEGAERSLWAARDARESGSTLHLARFLFDSGRRDEALPLFEEAAAAGDADAVEVLDEEYRGLVDRYDD